MTISKNKYLRLVKNFLIYKNIFFPIALLAFNSYLHQNSYNVLPLFRDVFETYDIPIYKGIFSTIGIFFWVSVFAICILTRNLLLKNKHKNKLKISFYNFACFLNLCLLLDDQFLLHEKNHIDLYFYFSYLVLIILLIIKLKKIILKKEIIYFVAALIFFLGSLIIDMDFFQAIWVRFVLEDTFKLIGIYYWLNFFSIISSRIISAEINYSSN